VVEAVRPQPCKTVDRDDARRALERSGGRSAVRDGGLMDTCDRCPAPARLRYERGTARLLMCSNHGDEHGTRLRLAGWFTYRIAGRVKV
jgi:hypothetical protein